LTSNRSVAPAVFGFVGRSGSGKTTLIAQVIAHLRIDGFSVAAIKRAHDGFDLDQPGKDSHRLREAGCREVMVVGDRRWALLHEYRDDPEPEPLALARQMATVDIVLVEGFKSAPIPMIEVYRPNLGRPPLWPEFNTVVAVVTDAEIQCPRPILAPDDVRGIASFVIDYLGLSIGKTSRAPRLSSHGWRSGLE
jgi:molybdopterin-guanine dinucleotide biosynthesis protein B